jgi:hypothetical protein
VNICNYKYYAIPVDSTELPKVWLPKYWPGKFMYAYYCIYALLDESYINDSTFVGMYSLKTA